MSALKLPCPFCGQKPMRAVKHRFVVCITNNCAIEGVEIKDEEWTDRRAPKAKELQCKKKS